MRRHAIVPVLTLILALSAYARAERVRVLESDAHSAVLGTDDFSLRVGRTGAGGGVTVGETEYCWLIRLYTRPDIPGEDGTVRAVQGEVSRGGLGPPPETVDPQIRGENASVVIRRTCARDQIDAGAPMYDLTQTVTVHPSGLINLRYEFDWLRLVDLHSASLIMALRAAPLDGCRWYADFTSHTESGVIDAAPDARSIAIRNQKMRTFTAQCAAADLHVWINRGSEVSMRRWNPKDYAVFIQVPNVSRHAPVYPGVRSVIDVDLKLPVPGED